LFVNIFLLLRNSQKTGGISSSILAERNMALMLYKHNYIEIPAGHFVPLCKITPNDIAIAFEEQG